MKCEILQPFQYSDDGISLRMLHAGEVVDIRADLAPGLMAARLIIEVDPSAEVSAPATVEAEAPAEEAGEAEEDGEAEEEGDATESAGTGEMEVRAVGNNRYAVFRGEEQLTGNLSKRQADQKLAELSAA